MYSKNCCYTEATEHSACFLWPYANLVLTILVIQEQFTVAIEEAQLFTKEGHCFVHKHRNPVKLANSVITITQIHGCVHKILVTGPVKVFILLCITVNLEIFVMQRNFDTEFLLC